MVFPRNDIEFSSYITLIKFLDYSDINCKLIKMLEEEVWILNDIEFSSCITLNKFLDYSNISYGKKRNFPAIAKEK